MKRHITFSMVLLLSADGKAIQSAATNQKMMESRREKESNGGMRRNSPTYADSVLQESVFLHNPKHSELVFKSLMKG